MVSRWPGTLRIGLLGIGIALALPVPATGQTAGRKFVRGLAGMTTAYLEVPGNMAAETRRRGPAGGLPLGFALGCGKIVPRVLVGVYEFLSAPFPAPSRYRPILEPEFPWGYFERAEPPRRRRM